MNIDIDTIVGKLTKAEIWGHDKASIEERFPAPLTGQIRWLVCMRLYGTSEKHVQKVLDEYGKSLWVRDDVNKRKQDIVLFSLVLQHCFADSWGLCCALLVCEMLLRCQI